MLDELLDTSKLVNELIFVIVVLTFCLWGNEKANITMHPKLLEVLKSGECLGTFVLPSIKAGFKCFIVFWKQYTDSSLTTEVGSYTYDTTYYTLV